MTVRLASALVAGLIFALAGPVAAQAATKTVYLGPPAKDVKTLQQKYGSDSNDFFPHSIAIRAGDSIKFSPTGFHSVDIPAKGKTPVGLIAPGAAVSGAMDAAGAPFWFNGQPSLGFTPALVMNNLFGGGKKATYTGAAAVLSGLPIVDHPKAFTVKFTKPGTVTYYCNIHEGMKGNITVLPKSRKAPSVKADAKRVAAQVATAIRIAKQLAATKPAAGTVDVGASGDHGVEAYSFFPSKLTVPVGTTLKFQMTPKSFEAHTATTGPGNPETEPTSYLGKLAASLNSPAFDPAVTYPSDVPGPPASLTPTFHGNGFWNSGFMAPKLPPLPSSNSVTFAAAGTYQFYCMIHPFMHATITVQ